MTGRSRPATAKNAAAGNSLVLPEQKILFVQVTKAACTSIKWLMAEISGQDTDRFAQGLSDEASRRMLVHNRRLWKGVARLSQLSPQERAKISPEKGWFVFAVVRDPRLRVWSAWQSKFLVGDPVFNHRLYAGADWLPRVPRSAEDVLEDWRHFVDRLAEGQEPAKNSHFSPQAPRLYEDRIPYSRIYEIRELPQMVADLGAHLDRHRIKHSELRMPRENDTPLKAGSEVFAEGVLEKLNTVYAGDLERFGQFWNLDDTLARPVEWEDAALRDIAQRVALGERIADLHSIARRERARRTELEAALARAQAERRADHDPVHMAPASELVNELGRRIRGRLVVRDRRETHR